MGILGMLSGSTTHTHGFKCFTGHAQYNCGILWACSLQKPEPYKIAYLWHKLHKIFFLQNKNINTRIANPRKRHRDELDVSENDAPIDKVTVNALVTELSPIKVSKNNISVKYFNAKLNDGIKTIRLISFSPNIHDDMEKAHLESQPIALTNCQVKEIASQYKNNDDTFEIVASNKTAIEITTMKSFQLPDNLTITLSEIDNTAINQSVTISVKILETHPMETIVSKTGKQLI